MVARTLIRLSLIFLAIYTSTAYAERFYVGAGLGYAESENDLVDADFTTVHSRFGATPNRFFGGEIRIGIGVSEDDGSIPGAEIETEMDRYIGLLIRGGMKFGPVYPHLIAGIMRTQFEICNTTADICVEDKQTDFAFGIGADIDLDFNSVEGYKLNVEYLNLRDKDDVEVRGLSVGITKHF